MSKKDIVTRGVGAMVLKAEIFIFAFKNSDVSIIEHRQSVLVVHLISCLT